MWIDELPHNLQVEVRALVVEHPGSEPVLSQLAAHFAGMTQDKKRKLNASKSTQSRKTQPSVKSEFPGVSSIESCANPPKVERVSEHVLKFSLPIPSDEVIFQLQGLSFISPVRRKFNLVFHLHIDENKTPTPVLSIVNTTTNVPEFSVTNLPTAFKLCMIVPVLGNTTVSTKKDTVMLSLWLDDVDPMADVKSDPIICTLNLDLIKKQLTTDGKIPPHSESQISNVEPSSDSIKPINELIVEFLQRQFSLCGVNLLNFLPYASLGKNKLNMNDDSVICFSKNADFTNDLVAASAYKGSKEGSILLVSASQDIAFLVFGFKKPILLMPFSSLKAVSFANITRFTFSMLVTIVNDKGVEESHEFGMIDQKSFNAIDEFVKRMNIEDNSFDEKYREKRPENKNGVNGETQSNEENPLTLAVGGGASDDEEEDGTYTVAAEEDGSGSEVDEDYDSNVESGNEAEDSGDSDEESDEEEKDSMISEDGEDHPTES